MANQVFRPMPVYFNGKKIAETSTSNYDHQNNNANQIGLDGVMGQSRGADETKIEFDTACPVAGHEINFKQAMMGQLTVTMAVAVDGGLEQVDGTITGRTYSSDSKSGELKGKWSFIGGRPQIT